MKRAIPNLYAEYGRYIDEFRAIPYYIDCLKPAERRLLIVLWDVAKKKLVKSARIVGDTIGKFHPHGDASTYGVLVGLVRRNFAIGQGNWGAVGYEDTDPAAYRYTECKSNPALIDLAFEFIKQVPWHDPENISHDQPKYLPSPVPVGLIGDGVIQGISFNTTKMPRYPLPELVKRLIYKLKLAADPSLAIAPETIIPVFPGCTVYESQTGEYEKILTKGKGNIIVVPRYDVLADGIHLYGKPAGGFSSLKKNANDPNKPLQPKYDVIDATQWENGEAKIEIIIQPHSGVVDQPFIDLIHRLVTDNVHFLCNVVYDGGIVTQTPIDDLLMISYEHWVNAYKYQLTQQQKALMEKIYELTVISVIRQIIQTSGQTIVKSDDVITIYNNTPALQNKTIGDEDIRMVINKYKIKTLLDYQIDNTRTQTELNNISTLLNNIGITAYNKLMKMIPVM